MQGSNYRVNFEVRATTQGFDAGMNRINRGLTQIGGGFRRSGVDAGFMANQLKAVGTTARYYLAGRLVYGIQSAISNLGQFKTQLGEIDALATRVSANGAITDISGQLNQLGQDALLMSNHFGASVGEVETYMQRFQTAMGSGLTKLSTSQQRQQITEFVRSHLNLVTMLGNRAGDPNELAGGLASMIRRMPGGERRAGANATTLSNWLGYILTNSPQLSGANISQASGRLASAQTLARMSPLDVLGVYGYAAKSGGSPAVITRGIAQMLSASLMHPTKPESQAVYMSAGLPTDPNELAKMGGMSVLTKLMDYLKTSARPGQKLNYDALYSVFSRQESVRQFANLLSEGGVKGLKDFIHSLKEANKANYTEKAAANRLRYSTLVRAQNAMTNLGISLVSGADGPLELAGRGVIGLSNFAAKHQTATEAIVDTSLGLYATNKLRRLGAFSGVGSRLSSLGGRFGKFGKLLGGAGKFLDIAQSAESAAASQAIMAQEFPSVLGGGAADGSRANPYWVIISPFSWQFNTPFGNGGGSGGGDPTVPSGGKGWLKKTLGRLKRVVTNPVAEGAEGAGATGVGARVAMLGGGTALGLGAVLAAIPFTLSGDSFKTYMGANELDMMKWLTHDTPGRVTKHSRYRYLAGIMNLLTSHTPAGMSAFGKLPKGVQQTAFDYLGTFGDLNSRGAFKPNTANAQKYEQMLEQMLGHSVQKASRGGGGGIFDQIANAAHAVGQIAIHVEGTAKMQLDLTTYDANGNKVHLKKGVKAKLIPTTSFPSSGGKPGSRRGK